jgi:hypothetical protein
MDETAPLLADDSTEATATPTPIDEVSVDSEDLTTVTSGPSEKHSVLQVYPASKVVEHSHPQIHTRSFKSLEPDEGNTTTTIQDLSTEDRLVLLCQQKSWGEFTYLAYKIAATSDMEKFASYKLATMQQISQDQHDHSRQGDLTERVPSGFHLVKATGDGNCLFHSASISLVGEEQLSNKLRLYSVLQAVLHYDEYMKKYTSLATTLELAQEYLKEYCTDEVYLRRPKGDGVTCMELIQFMLREETQNTAKLGAYSGGVVNNPRRTCTARGCVCVYIFLPL